MTDEPVQRPITPPAAPTTSAEASARLATLTADPAWGARVLSGADPAATKEFHDLSEMAADGSSDVDIAMRGELPDVPSSTLKHMAGLAEMLRSMGFHEKAVRETIEGKPAPQAAIDLATALKSQHMRSPEFVRAFLNGEPDQVLRMAAVDAVLSSPVKKAEAA